MRGLSELAEDILVTRSFNRVVVCCKVFHRESMEAFKETELHEEDETTPFLCLLVQGLKDCTKLSHPSLQEEPTIPICSLLLRETLRAL